MGSRIIAAAGAFLLVAAGLVTAEEAWAAAENRPAQTVSGTVKITGEAEGCPDCALGPGQPFTVFACFEGTLEGDLEGTFTSALFENPFFLSDSAPESATLRACSNVTLSDQRKFETSDKIFAQKNAETPFGFDVTGELLQIVGRGDCNGMIALLGDALQGTSYVGRLVCPPRR